ncbi:hypothetical protein LCGC14_1799570, partial [marine sediment metagenome]
MEAVSARCVVSTETETLKIIVKLKDSASRGLKRLAGGLREVRNKAGAAMSKLGGLRGVIVTLGVGLLARSFIQAADTAEQYRVRLTVLLGSVEEGNRLFQEMADYASTVSFQYEEIMGAATNLSGVMKGGVDEVKKWMPLIADLAAATGLSINDTAGQIIRMYSAGAASADMFRERGVLAMLGFQAKVSYSAKETRKQLMKVFDDPKSQFGGAAKALAGTWSGMLSMMSDRWFQFRNMVMEAGVFDFIKAGLGLWLKALADLKEEGNLDTWAENMAEVVMKAMSSIAISVGWVVDSMRGWKMLYDGLKLLIAELGKAATQLPQAVDKGLSFHKRSLKLHADAAQATGDLIEKTGKRLEKAYGPDVGMDRWIGWWGGVFAKGGETLAKGGEKATQVLGTWKEGMKEVQKEAEIAEGWFDAILEKTLKSLEATATQIPWNERVKEQLKEINDLIEKQRKEREAAQSKVGGMKPKPGEERPTLPLGILLRSEMIKFKEQTKTQLAYLNANYDLHIVKLEGFYKERKRLANEAYQFELTRLQQMADAEEEPKKKEKILLQIFRMQEAHQRNLLALEQERNKALEDRIQGEKESGSLVADATARATLAGPSEMVVRFAEQLRELESMQRDETDRMQELKDEGHATEQQAEALHKAQLLEKEKLFANQKRQIVEQYMNNTVEMLGNIGDAFLDFYKATGSKNKAFFE